MSQSKTLWLDQEQIDGLEYMQEHGFADNESEAARKVMNVGLQKYGQNDNPYDSSIRQYTRLIGWGLACIGAFVVALAYFGSLEFRLLATVPWIMSLTCYAIDKALARVEPRVTNRIVGLWSGEKA